MSVCLVCLVREKYGCSEEPLAGGGTAASATRRHVRKKRSVDEAKAANQMFSHFPIILKLEDEHLRGVSGRNLCTNANAIRKGVAMCLSANLLKTK